MSAAAGTQGCVVWFTGLSGAGKTTIARHAVAELNARGKRAFLLDGDVVRKGLSSDLGFSAAARRENLRRAAEVAALLADAGLIVLAAFITPLEVDRESVRRCLAGYPLIEVFVSTPLPVAERRDPKGLYRRARCGDLLEFTGIDSPYEPPETPDLRLDATSATVASLADALIEAVLARFEPD